MKFAKNCPGGKSVIYRIRRAEGVNLTPVLSYAVRDSRQREQDISRATAKGKARRPGQIRGTMKPRECWLGQKINPIMAGQMSPTEDRSHKTGTTAQFCVSPKLLMLRAKVGGEHESNE